MTPKPILALTLGDVAGIGPEITAKTLLRHPDLRSECVPVVIGDADAMRRGVQSIGGDPSAVRVIGDPADAANDPARIEVIQVGPSLASVPVGEVSASRRRRRVPLRRRSVRVGEGRQSGGHRHGAAQQSRDARGRAQMARAHRAARA